MTRDERIEVHRLHLTDVTPAPHLPWTRPTFPVFAHLVVHPVGPILIDTGVGIGHSLIDEMYSPTHHSLDDALRVHDLATTDIGTVITSHLHFDHCGQNDRFPHATVIVQQAEVDAAREARYTVPEWAFPANVSLTVIDGDHDVVSGVRILATPGHTCGHQSVLVDCSDGIRTLVCCQASWDVASYGATSLGDDGWDPAIGAASLEKVHALEPDVVLLSHDANEWRRT